MVHCTTLSAADITGIYRGTAESFASDELQRACQQAAVGNATFCLQKTRTATLPSRIIGVPGGD
jgi:hypothetical protein